VRIERRGGGGSIPLQSKKDGVTKGNGKQYKGDSIVVSDEHNDVPVEHDSGQVEVLGHDRVTNDNAGGTSLPAKKYGVTKDKGKQYKGGESRAKRNDDNTHGEQDGAQEEKHEDKCADEQDNLRLRTEEQDTNLLVSHNLEVARAVENPVTERSLRTAATRCNTLQHVAAHCNALQRAAPRCNTQSWAACRVLPRSPLVEPQNSGAQLRLPNATALQHTHTHTHRQTNVTTTVLSSHFKMT